MTPRRKSSPTVFSKPPATFPTVIKPHAYDPSGLGTCLHCGQDSKNRLHIRPHAYSPNYFSKLLKCMCGLRADHPIHIRGVKN